MTTRLLDIDDGLVGRRRDDDSAVGLEHAVVHQPSSSVELGEEGLYAEAVLVVIGWDGFEDGKTDDGLEMSGQYMI